MGSTGRTGLSLLGYIAYEFKTKWARHGRVKGDKIIELGRAKARECLVHVPQ